MKKIKVKLQKNNSYDILIEENILKEAGKFIKELNLGNKTYIITDQNVEKHHLKTLKDSLIKSDINITEIFILKAGEHLKSFVNLAKLSNDILATKPDRNSTIIALGGGVIGDLSGFLASIVLRGINYIQIPTTLLSQVDSSVGGKTAINTNAGKNLIGSFYQPKLVLIDPKTISTLPERQFLAGYVEAFKYSLIRDKDFFNFLEKNKERTKKKDNKILTEIIYQSCLNKAEIVQEDEKETSGLRATLNFGHTFAHALEKHVGYNDILLHGEAVAIGMVMASKFSEELGLCKKGESDKIISHFDYFSIATNLDKIKQDFSAEKIFSYMQNDKKNLNDKIILILIEEIGKAFLTKNIKDNNLLDFIKSSFKD